MRRLTPIPAGRNAMHEHHDSPISVVIVTYNGLKYLPECIDSLAKQSFSDFEIIVVDNCSSDGSAEFVREHYPQVRVIRAERNLGFSAGTNLGIRASKGAFIFTLNNDTRTDPACIEQLFLAMNSNPRIGICGSKMLFPDGRINSTGICISRSGAAWDRGMFEPDNGQYSVREEVFGACAGAALYRKAMLDQIGFFDEGLFMYLEDVDISYRARLAGWTCMYVPGAIVHHHHGGSAGSRSDMAVYFVNRNSIWITFKNVPSSLLFAALPWIIGRHCALAGYYSLRGRARVILRSKIDALIGIVPIMKKRKLVIKAVGSPEIGRWIHQWAQIPLQL